MILELKELKLKENMSWVFSGQNPTDIRLIFKFANRRRF